MENGIIVYFVSKDGGFLNKDIIRTFIERFEARGYSVEDVGMGSAYNMPVYLLGEISDHYDKAVVVSFDVVNDMPKPMVFFDSNEIDALMKGLEAAKEGEDTFDIITAVHKELRGL